jgi:hypothetical protein
MPDTHNNMARIDAVLGHIEDDYTQTLQSIHGYLEQSQAIHSKEQEQLRKAVTQAQDDREQFHRALMGGLSDAPLIDSCRIPVDSGGMQIGRGSCQYCHSSNCSFRQNRGIPELIPECSAEFTGTECNRNSFTGM